MKKHHAKKVIRKTPAKCVTCTKVLTTIDMCYSSDIHKCWSCDKLPVQTQLF